MVSGVGRGMGVLDGGGPGGDCRRGRGRFGVEVGRPIVTNGDFVAKATRSCYKLLWEDKMCASCDRYGSLTTGRYQGRSLH